MPRRPRICPAGTCFHVINRTVARLPLFEKEGDYEAFERVLGLLKKPDICIKVDSKRFRLKKTSIE